MENVCLTPVSVHGVNLLSPVSTLLRTSQSSPMESAGTGMTVFILSLSVNNALLSQPVQSVCRRFSAAGAVTTATPLSAGA